MNIRRALNQLGASDRLSIRLFLCGDVMTGRGIDQVLPHPSDPAIHEPYVKNAKDYVQLAESANGPIPKPVSFSYKWGDALEIQPFETRMCKAAANNKRA